MSRSWDIKSEPPDFNTEWQFKMTATALEDLASYGHLHGHVLSIHERAELRILAEMWRQAGAEFCNLDVIGESIKHLFPFEEQE